MRVLIFIALKIVEVLGVVFLPFYLGKWQFPDDIWIIQWLGVSVTSANIKSKNALTKYKSDSFISAPRISKI